MYTLLLKEFPVSVNGVTVPDCIEENSASSPVWLPTYCSSWLGSKPGNSGPYSTVRLKSLFSGISSVFGTYVELDDCTRWVGDECTPGLGTGCTLGLGDECTLGLGDESCECTLGLGDDSDECTLWLGDDVVTVWNCTVWLDDWCTPGLNNDCTVWLGEDVVIVCRCTLWLDDEEVTL